MISDTPGRGGEGGQERANFCGRPLWMAPLRSVGKRRNSSINKTETLVKI